MRMPIDNHDSYAFNLFHVLGEVNGDSDADAEYVELLFKAPVVLDAVGGTIGRGARRAAAGGAAR
jgi:anthranilate/para-aminobenzoate synthase component II